MLPSQPVNPGVIAESLEMVYPLKCLIQEAAPTSSLASWASPGHTTDPTYPKGLESVVGLPTCPGKTQAGNLYSNQELAEAAFGNRREDRHPLFIE